MEILFFNDKRSVRYATTSCPLASIKQKDGVFIPNDPDYLRLFATALRAAQANLNILIQGETGTGKEVLVRYIYNNLYAGKPIVTLNCGAIPKELLESELFGYARGAFSGALQDKPGLLEMASGGILFLDEIGTMSLELQHKILRVIENKIITPIGAKKEIPVEFALISATNRDLAAAIDEGEFREDLYYRVCQFGIETIPLRHSKEVIVQFIDYFVTLFNKQYHANYYPGTEEMLTLMNNPWKGNIRQLKNEIQTRVALGRIDAIKEANRTTSSVPYASISLKEKITFYEKSIILEALKSHNNNTTKAALYLGTNRTTLLSRMKKLGIPTKTIHPGNKSYILNIPICK